MSTNKQLKAAKAENFSLEQEVAKLQKALEEMLEEQKYLD